MTLFLNASHPDDFKGKSTRHQVRRHAAWKSSAPPRCFQSEMTTPTSSSRAGPQTDTSYIQALRPSTHEVACGFFEILCFLHPGSISTHMLQAAPARQEWSPRGERREKNHLQEVDSELTRVLVSRERFREVVDAMEEQEWITTDSTRSILTVDQDQGALVQQRNPVWRKVQAIALVCQAFPTKDIEPLFGNCGRCFVHHVRRALALYSALESSQHKFSKDLKHAIVSTLLSASYFLDMVWKAEAVRAAMHIAADLSDEYLLSCARLRCIELEGLHDPVEILPEPPTALNARTRALAAKWLLASANNLIRQDQLNNALRLIDGPLPLRCKSPSRLERLMLHKIRIVRGRIYCFAGRFRDALAALPLDDEFSFVDAYDHAILLAQTLAELKDTAKAMKILQVQSRANPLADKTAIYSRLRLTMAEIHLQMGDANAAGNELSTLSINRGTSPYFTNLLKLRLHIALARVEHLHQRWSNAQEHWQRALDVAGSSRGFIQGVIHYSISHASSQSGDLSASTYHRQRGVSILVKNGRQHWYLGLGTTWLDHLGFDEVALTDSSKLVSCVS